MANTNFETDPVRRTISDIEAPESCDYLVIGAGSGGAAVAGRLARQSDARVVLLEAGGTHHREDVVRPSGWPELLASDANWAYKTLPQEGTDGREHVWSMGKVLGGSSSVNGMMYMRGASWDYDAWVEHGNPGWDPETVFAAFREMEDYPEGDPEQRGTGGPVKLELVDGKHPVTATFLEACAERGIPRAEDFNGKGPEGYAPQQLNARDGERQSSAVAFLDPLADRENLTVITNATAQQLIFEPATTRVREVVYDHGGELRTIKVDEEVLLGAGAIASPQLLLLSGVGPADELRRLGIDVVVDLPGVGANLHDHIGVPVAFESKQPVPPSQYQLVEANVYCRTDPGQPHYDMQIPLQLFPYVPPGFEGYAFENGFTFFAGILKPRSRGRVSLQSADPAAPPVVDPAYLTHPDDLPRLANAVGVARDIGASPAFDEWRLREAVPGPGVSSPEELERYIRSAASTYFHPVGTCGMGSDEWAVVDHRLRVHGVENLRVVDASVMPEIVSANTNAPAMMVGWRAAGFILGVEGYPAEDSSLGLGSS